MKCIIFIFHLNFDIYVRNVLHEQAVDSFVYENCTSNVDTFTEFCTGHALLQGAKLVYDMNYIDKENSILEVGLSHIEGRKYIHHEEQHSKIDGDICHGAAGNVHICISFVIFCPTNILFQEEQCGNIGTSENLRQ